MCVMNIYISAGPCFTGMEMLVEARVKGAPKFQNCNYFFFFSNQSADDMVFAWISAIRHFHWLFTYLHITYYGTVDVFERSECVTFH